jgi:hypothetical protein
VHSDTRDTDATAGRANRTIVSLAAVFVVAGLALSIALPVEQHVSMLAVLAVSFVIIVMLTARALHEPLSAVGYFFTILALACALFAVMTERTGAPAQAATTPTRTPLLPAIATVMTEIPRPTHTSLPTSTATRTPTQTPTPTPVLPGTTRAMPFQIGEAFKLGPWQATVLAVTRGDPAWQALKAANQFNKPAPEGMEYVLATIQVAYTVTDAGEQSVRSFDWRLTGSRYVQYLPAGVVSPRRLDTKIYTAFQVEGDVPFLVRKDENNLMLVYMPLEATTREKRYVAAEAGASLSVPAQLASIKPDALGTSRSAPAAIGQTVTAYGWQATLLEVQRGEPAWQAIKAANQFNKPADTGREYVLARVRLRNVQASSGDAVAMTSGLFHVTGSRNVVYDQPAVVPPSPTPDGYLYAGGETEGWVVGQAAQGETNLLLVFRPIFMSDMGRFMATE